MWFISLKKKRFSGNKAAPYQSPGAHSKLTRSKVNVMKAENLDFQPPDNKVGKAITNNEFTKIFTRRRGIDKK